MRAAAWNKTGDQLDGLPPSKAIFYLDGAEAVPPSAPRLDSRSERPA